MSPISGEWFHQNARPILKAENAVGQDVASCDLGDGIVTSEKATGNLRQRSITVIVDKPTASSSEGWTSAYVVWRPLIAVNVLRVQGINLGVYGNATCDILAIYGNAGTSISQISYKAVASTEIAAGTRTAGAAINRAALAACTDVLVKVTGSTCSYPSQVALAIDYESTG